MSDLVRDAKPKKNRKTRTGRSGGKSDTVSTVEKTDTREEALVKGEPLPVGLPILPLSDTVLFPEMVLPWVVHGEQWVRLVNDAILSDKLIGLVARRPREEQDGDIASSDELFDFGVMGKISRMLKLPEGAVQILVLGLSKIKIVEWKQEEPYPIALVEHIQDRETQNDEVEAMVRAIVALFQKVVELAPHLPREIFVAAMNMKNPTRLAHFVVSNLNLDVARKQEILILSDLQTRLHRVNYYLTRELEILQIGSRIQNQIHSEMAKTQREYLLREQLKAVQRELGELDDRSLEMNEIRGKIEQIRLPDEVRIEAGRELDRLSRIPPASAEYPVLRNYLDWIVELPWSVMTEDALDMAIAERILDEDHHDLEKVKERILEYLAVCTLKKNIKGPILCFVGPPGVGKTSLGKSIARAMERRFVRISLGGVRDEAEIRGHRRTYVGALPGRIIQGIRKAGTRNPVFMLDEVDKLGLDFRGDPAASLLEVLDPEQNSAFADHYLGVPFDLSRVLFIATANMLDTIPSPLLDRMEVIRIPGYTDRDKMAIARRYLLPRQMDENGIPEGALLISDEILMKIIREYTREAGVRNLEREIASLYRKTARRIASGEGGSFEISEDRLRDYLGPRRFSDEAVFGKDRIGVATGLAWTKTGGDVLFVEAAVLPGKGKLILTGHLGEIMQESARIAYSCVRERTDCWHVERGYHEKSDFHIHVPSGAIPKDGPSAGITMVVALLSALSRLPVRHNLAMTGEITLTGRVLAIGGVKEKVLAAHRTGIKKVILPEENVKDLEEIPSDIRKKITFFPVKTIDEVLEISFRKKRDSNRNRNCS
ncbi:MAG TPA: endopeptidase La [Atribacteraceae bacterium]|nr:endopeptidase La [Atribacteraceae bacterium]